MPHTRLWSCGLFLVLACSNGSRVAQPPTEEGPVTRDLIPPMPPPEMVEQLIAQRVLDHPRVAAFLHAQTEPVRVWAIPELARGAPALTVAGRPVRFVTNESEAQSLFRRMERVGTEATERVSFEIPAEGVTGHVDVQLRDYVWRAVDAVVTER